MDFFSKLLFVTILFSMTVLLNLPFGFFRKREKRYSLKWFLYIHIPIPFIILIRVLSHLDFRYIPLFIFAAVVGQVWGQNIVSGVEVISAPLLRRVFISITALNNFQQGASERVYLPSRLSADISSTSSHRCLVEGISACTHSFSRHQGKTFPQKTADPLHGDMHGLHDLGCR